MFTYSFRIICDKGAISLLESREKRYIKATNNNNKLISVKLLVRVHLQRQRLLLECCYPCVRGSCGRAWRSMYYYYHYYRFM